MPRIATPRARVVRVLDRLAETCGLPKAIVLDNGPEMRGLALDPIGTKKAALGERTACSVKVVAGAEFEPATFRL